MKKKVAILANGCNYEILYRFEESLYKNSSSFKIDYFNFLWNATQAFNNHTDSKGIIFRLPDLKQFDAIVIFNPGLNLAEQIDYVYNAASEAHIPVISIGMEYPGFSYIGIDNYSGMKELCNHLLDEHNVKSLHVIAGSMDNDDSNTRVHAVWDALSEHGIGINPNHVFYSDWLTNAAAGYIDRLFENNEQIPDAFICANDYLAEMVTYVLSTHGINVPDDCIVTGFDYNEEGRIFFPSIATIDQRYDLIGQTTARLLIDTFNGEPVDSSTRIECIYIPGDSCGCHNQRNAEQLRQEYGHSLLLKRRNKIAIDSVTSNLQKAIIESINYEELKENLKKAFSESSGYEGPNFFIMMDPKLDKISETEITDTPGYSFADRMDVVAGKRNGISVNADSISIRDLIPEYNDEDDNHTYYFIPIYFDTYACGYAVFCDKNEWVLEKNFVAFEDVLTRNFELYRSRIQINHFRNKKDS